MALGVCLQELQGKGDGGRKKVSLHRFLVDQKVASAWKEIPLLAAYWAVQAGLLTPLTFVRHRSSPLAAFTSGAYFLHNGRR